MTSFRQMLKDVDVPTFFEKTARVVFEERREELDSYLECPVIICTRMMDTDRLWTSKVSTKRLVIEDEEMVDFPVITVEGREENWPLVREATAEILDLLDARREEYKGKGRWTQKIQEAFEAFDGTISVTLTDPSLSRPIGVRIILNNYEDSGYKTFHVTVPLSTLYGVARGEIALETAAKGLKIGGDMSLALDLGGFFATHFKV